MASNPLARYAASPPRNPLARYAKTEKDEREVPTPPAGSGGAVKRAVRNVEYRREEARRQKALKVLQRARELDKKWERQRRYEVSKERVERAVRRKTTLEQQKQRRDEARIRDALKREQWKKIEKEQWTASKFDKSKDTDPFDRPRKTMSDNLDYRTHRQAAAIKRGGPEPKRVANAVRTGVAAGRLAARAVPVIGAIATGYDVANMLGGPPTKDPSKFRNYKGFPKTTKTPKVKK